MSCYNLQHITSKAVEHNGPGKQDLRQLGLLLISRFGTVNNVFLSSNFCLVKKEIVIYESTQTHAILRHYQSCWTVF